VSGHKFKVGQNVNFTAPFSNHQIRACKIVQLLPAEDTDDEFKYRIKSDDEPHERIVSEGQLELSAAI
jgi:hypothetical protein